MSARAWLLPTPLLAAVAVWLACWPGVSAVQSAVSPVLAQSPDAPCATCHRAIYDRYEATPMARASGPAADGVIAGSFHHQSSGIDYSVLLHDGQAAMTYHRAGSSAPLDGEAHLKYFIGSGHRGRTYLYEESGRWFQAPINFYSRKGVWDMLPGYGDVTSMPSSLIVEASCLHCHATGVNQALPQARNAYPAEPFRQTGIGCSACHGDASAHLASGGKAPIANPRKMSPVARDSTCLQCHVEGEAAIFRAGKSATSYRVGESLWDSAVYFVRAGAQGGGGRAVSQYEALLRSVCKRASGDKLTCTNCHDPHDSPAPAERIQYFRAKCLNCHTGEEIATKHHPEQQDCASCHMPQRNPTDVAHEQSTDHDIERIPAATLPKASSSELVTVGNVSAGDRDLGLAYASFAKRGDQRAGEMALSLLRRAEASGANDLAVHTELGFLEQMSGDLPGATKEYEAALRENEFEASALGNLGVIEARSGHIESAIALLKRVVAADPTQTAAGLNLAFIECRTGDKTSAVATLNNLRRFAPDDPTLRTFAASGVYGGLTCPLK